MVFGQKTNHVGGCDTINAIGMLMGSVYGRFAMLSMVHLWGAAVCGLAIEMAKAVLQMAFPAQPENIVALIDPRNAPSRRLAQRAGFHFERNITWKSVAAMLYRKPGKAIFR